jgi:serine protease inhibitor
MTNSSAVLNARRTQRVPLASSKSGAARRAVYTSFLFAFLAACADPGEPAQQEPPRETPRNFTLQEAKLADASVGFGLQLYRRVSGGASEANVLVSPLSASMALGMAMNGAQGGTYDAMRTTLGFGTLSEAEVNESYRGLIAQLLARDSKVSFTIANSVWHERTFSVLNPFLNAARTFFDAEVTSLDFADPTAPRTISAWAEQKTGGRIKDLIQQIDPQEIMFLVNAVYFKGPWSSPFDSNSTRIGPFRRADGSSVNVPLMFRDGSFRWAKQDGVQVLELLYGDSAYSMVLLAPDDGGSLATLEAKLTASWWNSVLASVQPNRVIVIMPKFKFEFGKKLNDALTDQGMGIAFDRARADFYRIADVRPERIYISRVEQKTFITVNEAGTEAAAATAVGFGVTSVPPSIEFTRPFLFAIRERESGTLLFFGRVGDPSAN